MTLTIEQLPVRSDNYAVIIHDEASGQTAAIDAPEAAPIRDVLRANGWGLDLILVTHHHQDHVEGIPALKADFGSTVIGPTAEASRIAGLDRTVAEGDTFSIGAFEVRVLETPGHTAGHISYWIPEAKVAFVADTLFALGCGRMFEGTAEMMWNSMTKLLALPDDTQVYCGHEYTASNAAFAVTIDPENGELAERAREIAAKREAGQPTLPTTMGLEKRTNPFLRVDAPAIRTLLGMANATQAEVFGEIRRRKDNF